MMRRFQFTPAAVSFSLSIAFYPCKGGEPCSSAFCAILPIQVTPYYGVCSADIAVHMKAEFRLTGRHTMTDQKEENEDRFLKSVVVAPHQTWVATVEGGEGELPRYAYYLFV